MKRKKSDYVKEIGDLLNIQVTKKGDKSIPGNSRSNPLMAGFPTQGKNKFVSMLTDAAYTVVMVEQTTPPPNPKRAITMVYSPGTFTDTIRQYNNIYITEIVVERIKGLFKDSKLSFSFGVSSIDLSTGESVVEEIQENPLDIDEKWERLRTFVEIYPPKEVEVHLIGFESEYHSQLFSEIERNLSLYSILYHKGTGK